MHYDYTLQNFLQGEELDYAQKELDSLQRGIYAGLVSAGFDNGRNVSDLVHLHGLSYTLAASSIHQKYIPHCGYKGHWSQESINDVINQTSSWRKHLYNKKQHKKTRRVTIWVGTITSVIALLTSIIMHNCNTANIFDSPQIQVSYPYQQGANP